VAQRLVRFPPATDNHAMQLRVARLCLDCEELHVADACPVCASLRYAFLSAWLPSEERRRWKRPAPAVTEPQADGVGAVINRVAEWFGAEPETAPPKHPRTRAGDRVPTAAFEKLADRPAKTRKQPSIKTNPAKSSAR
jgi:hypothetical protein